MTEAELAEYEQEREANIPRSIGEWPYPMAQATRVEFLPLGFGRPSPNGRCFAVLLSDGSFIEFESAKMAENPEWAILIGAEPKNGLMKGMDTERGLHVRVSAIIAAQDAPGGS